MIREEAYYQFLHEAQSRIVELHLEVVGLIDTGFGFDEQIKESNELKDAIDYVCSDTYTLEDNALFEFIDIMSLKHKLKKIGIILI